MKTQVDHLPRLQGFYRHSSDETELGRWLSSGKAEISNLAATNDTEEDLWVMVFDTDEVPEEGAVPLFRFPLFAGPSAVGVDIPIIVEQRGYVAVSIGADALAAPENGVWFYAHVKEY